MLERLRAHIVVSLDAVTPATYESIRRNARLEVVLENVEWLMANARQRGTDLSLAVCPMRHNWRELHLLLAYCAARKIGLFFNTVLRPPESSLATLSAVDLEEVIAYLQRVRPTDSAWYAVRNREQCDGLISQLVEWRREKLRFGAVIDAKNRAFMDWVGTLRHGDGRALVDSEVRAVLAPLMLSHAIEEEVRAIRVWELQNLLPRPPLPVSSNASRPRLRELLLASLLLSRFTAAGTEVGDAGYRSALVDEYLQLECSVARQEASGAVNEERVGDLAEAIRSRIENGQGVSLTEDIKGLLETSLRNDPLPVNVHWMITARCWEALENLHTEGPSQEEKDRTEHLVRLVMGMSSMNGSGNEVVDRFVASNGAAGDTPSEEDFRRMIDAMYVLYYVTAPGQDLAWFRGRVRLVQDTVTHAAASDRAWRALAAQGLGRSYKALVAMTNEELKQALESFM